MSSPVNGSLRVILRFHRAIAIGLQLALIVLSNWLAFALRFDGRLPDWAVGAFWQGLPWLLTIRALAFIPFRLYQGLWKYTSIYDLRALVSGIVASSAAFYLFVLTPFGPDQYPRSIFFMDAMILMMLLSGIRLTRRFYAELSRPEGTRRILIFGAGDAGELIVRDMRADRDRRYEPIGFIDDDRSKVGRRIHGVAVLGTTENVEDILEKLEPDEILIAIPTAAPSFIRELVRTLQPYNIPLKTLPNLRDIIDGKIEVGQIRKVSVEDLLARAPIGLDPEPLHKLIKGRRVLVTGAGGSIGSELCRQIARLDPHSLVMFDRYENTLHAIVTELVDLDAAGGFAGVVGDVTDTVRVEETLALYRPEIIFHAAAHKHVPLMEGSPCEAVKNNVRGTRIMAEAAERHGVDKFILISTDKAVNPTSVMGASKRMAELGIRYLQKGSSTCFATVRFGNVLASNGSVVPRFVEQIKRGGPVTVTHPEMRRFFMLIPEAVQLVLHAAAQAESGATYVLEMGEQVKLVDMARDMIRLSGFIPDEDIAIEFVGLRPGEKLYEELVGKGEEVGPSAVEKILKVTSASVPNAAWKEYALELEGAALAGNRARTAELLQRLVVDYLPMLESDNFIETPAVSDSGMTFQRGFLPSVPCPRCSERALRRSRVRSFYERLRKDWSAKRPFRCEKCNWRGWLVPLHAHLLPAEDLSSDVDLSGIDEAMLSRPPGRKQVFLPRNLR